MRFGESSSSRALQMSVTRTSACIADLVYAPSLPMTAMENTLTGNTWMSFLPLPMLAVRSQPRLWHRQRLSLANGVAIEDFHFYRQFCALFHYSTVGISGNDVDGNALVMDFFQQFFDAVQHSAIFCNGTVEVQNQVFDCQFAPAGDL